MVRLVVFVKIPGTARSLEWQGSRYKIITENGNELCTIRFAPFHQQTEHGTLFGAVRLAVKNRNGKRCFFVGLGKRFTLKNGKLYDFWLRFRVFLGPNRGNGRSRNGRVRCSTVRTNSNALLCFKENKDHLWFLYENLIRS